jgi:hypothetical protein
MTSMSKHHHSAWVRLVFPPLVFIGSLMPPDRPASAQPPENILPSPRLFVLTPPGAKAGTTVEVVFSGLDLEAPQGMLFSHPGIKAELIKPPAPPPPDPKKKPPPTAAPKTAHFKVTIAADVPVGVHDARVVNKWGASNPRAFVVGDLSEVQEKEPNNDVTEAQKLELNSTVNGKFDSPIDVDYYAFSGKKGQRVVVSCLASTIDSRAHPTLEIYDARGRLLASNRNYLHNDAVTDAVLSEDGVYHVRLCEFTHAAGGPEFYYRLSVSTAPWIDAVHPCVLEPGKATEVTVWGRNLPGGKLDPSAVAGDRVLEKTTSTIAVPSDPAGLQRLAYSGRVEPIAAGLDGFEYRLRNESGTSNPFLLTFARAPVVVDNEANDTPLTAQDVPLPCEIAGHFEKRHDQDWYAFSAKKGEVWVIELLSDRLGATTYPYFFLKTAAAKDELKESNDNQDVLNPKFFARTDDPAIYHFAVPADGRYMLLVGSRLADAVAGPRHYYRFRLTPEHPDFRLVAMAPANSRPESATVQGGGHQSFTVFALRQDGFMGDIALSVEGLPAGISCVPQTLGAGVRESQLVVSAAPGAAAWTGEIKLKGVANIRGQIVMREARQASIVWPVQPQQNIPTLSRADRSVVLAVREKAVYAATAKIDKTTLLQGEHGTLKVAISRLWPDFKAPVQVQAVQTQLPQGLTLNNNQPLNIAPNQTEGSLAVNVGSQVQPGTYTLVLRTQASVPYNKDPAAKNKQQVRVVQPTTPVTLTVVPKELGRLALSNPAPVVKLAGQTPLTVRVTRLFHYEGEFKVQVLLPQGAKGLEVGETVITAGKDEANLVLKATAGAAPGTLANLTLRATAQAFGATVNQEMKFNVNLVK